MRAFRDCRKSGSRCDRGAQPTGQRNTFPEETENARGHHEPRFPRAHAHAHPPSQPRRRRRVRHHRRPLRAGRRRRLISPSATKAATTATATTTPARATTATPAKATTATAAKASTVKAVTHDAAKPAAPAAEDLQPVAVTADQENLSPTKDQINNSRAIIEAGQKMKLPPRAWVIAVATSLQESQLKNIGNLGDANDHDSLGLFQQRPSSGWGTPDQLTNPQYAATAFYKGLIDVKGYDKMPLTDAAQAVQVSAFPDHYAKWETVAGHLVEAYYGTGPYTSK
jgi:hypothetical protein